MSICKICKANDASQSALIWIQQLPQPELLLCCGVDCRRQKNHKATPPYHRGITVGIAIAYEIPARFDESIHGLRSRASHMAKPLKQSYRSTCFSSCPTTKHRPLQQSSQQPRDSHIRTGCPADHRDSNSVGNRPGRSKKHPALQIASSPPPARSE